MKANKELIQEAIKATRRNIRDLESVRDACCPLRYRLELLEQNKRLLKKLQGMI